MRRQIVQWKNHRVSSWGDCCCHEKKLMSTKVQQEDPLVIQCSYGELRTCTWFAHENLHLWGVSHCHVWVRKDIYHQLKIGFQPKIAETTWQLYQQYIPIPHVSKRDFQLVCGNPFETANGLQRSNAPTLELRCGPPSLRRHSGQLRPGKTWRRWKGRQLEVGENEPI